MKILIDVDELEKNGVLTPQLAAALRTHSLRDTGATAINMLLAFGAIAVAAGLLAIVPSPWLAALFGLVFVAMGWHIATQYAEQWGILGSTWMIVGAIVLSAAVGVLIGHPVLASLCAALILGGVSILAESRLLIALTPFALASALGGSTGYWHACYEISIREPTLTIFLFSALAYVAWQIAQEYKGLYESLAITFARICLILVNFGFWIGSLWGDTPGNLWRDPTSFSFSGQQIPPVVFIIGWAIVLVLAGMWGAKNGRRFMVNIVAVFAAIHFYTQWFEHIGVYPVSIMVAGMITIAFGLGLWKYNRKVLSEKGA